MSWVALASFASFGIYVLIFLLLAMTGYRSPLGRALAILIIPYALWAFGNTFLLTSTTPESAFFWDSIASFGWVTFGPAMLNFSLVFTNTRLPLSSITKKMLFYGLPSFFIAAQWYGLISLPGKMMWYGHGVVLNDNIFVWLFPLYYMPYVIVALFLIVRHIVKTHGYERKQAVIILFAYIIPFTISAITDDVCPILKMEKTPPLAMIISLLLIGGILYAVARYRMLFSINPTRALFHSLSHSETVLKSFLDASPHIAFITDKNGTIQYTNRNASIQFYSEKNPLQQTNIDSLFSEKQLENFHQQLTRAEQTVSTQEQLYHFTTRLNRIFAAKLTISPLTDDLHNHLGFIIMMIDITTHEKAEQVLLFAKNRAEEADRAKSEFLANISHELYTPIDAIIAVTNLMDKSVVQPDTKDKIAIIGTSSRYLQALLSDLLDIARIESGKFNIFPEPIEIRPLVHTIADLFPPTTDIEFSLMISDTVPQHIILDPRRFQQIVINLLSNAFKFTQKGTVSLSLGFQNDTLIIIVSDSGIGISEEDQKTIFNKFSQGRQQRNLAVRGTGIGLAIVKELTNLMDGTVAVQSTLNEGSTFTVSLSVQEINN